MLDDKYLWVLDIMTKARGLDREEPVNSYAIIFLILLSRNILEYAYVPKWIISITASQNLKETMTRTNYGTDTEISRLS